MKKLKLSWLALMLVLLAWTMISYQLQPSPNLQDEILFRHSLAMLVLTFPSGVVADLFFGMALCVAKTDIFVVMPSLSLDFLMTVICGVAGYFQWFVVVPWVCRGVWRVCNRVLMGATK